MNLTAVWLDLWQTSAGYALRFLPVQHQLMQPLSEALVHLCACACWHSCSHMCCHHPSPVGLIHLLCKCLCCLVGVTGSCNVTSVMPCTELFREQFKSITPGHSLDSFTSMSNPHSHIVCQSQFANDQVLLVSSLATVCSKSIDYITTTRNK
jgi:hypothetical protein